MNVLHPNGWMFEQVQMKSIKMKSRERIVISFVAKIVSNGDEGNWL